MKGRKAGSQKPEVPAHCLYYEAAADVCANVMYALAVMAEKQVARRQLAPVV